MRYVDGESLRSRLSAKGTFTLAEAGQIIQGITAALTYAHARDIIHRDVKPSNIMLAKNGHTFVADFGIAADLDPDASFLTSSSQLASIGTEGYIAPEIRLRERATVRTDVYSLGVTIYEMLTTRQLARARFEGDPWASLPRSIVDVLWQATQEIPARRYPSVAALAEAFHQAVQSAHRGQKRAVSPSAKAPTRSIGFRIPVLLLTPQADASSRPAVNSAGAFVAIGVGAIILMLFLMLILVGGQGSVEEQGALATTTDTPITPTQTTIPATTAAPTVIPTTEVPALPSASWGEGTRLFVTRLETVRVSAGGALSSDPLQQLDWGTEVEVMFTIPGGNRDPVFQVRNGRWWHVGYPGGGIIGWLPREALSDVRPQPGDTPVPTAFIAPTNTPPLTNTLQPTNTPSATAHDWTRGQEVYTIDNVWLRAGPTSEERLLYGGVDGDGPPLNTPVILVNGPEYDGTQWWWQIQADIPESGLMQGWVEESALREPQFSRPDQ